MAKVIVHGGNRLSGNVKISGAKNSILPILIATLLCKGECIIHNCPNLSDVHTTLKILKYLGCSVHCENSTVTVNSYNITNNVIPENMMCEMRSSIVFLGALLARVGEAKLTFPGGCDLGPRPIDLHLTALKNLGVSISEQGGYISGKANKNDTKGRVELALSFPSVGATENIILSSVLRKGVTVVTNIAQEPEIADLIRFLCLAGAKIDIVDGSTVKIEGVDCLHGVEYKIIPDRIEAITYMAATAMTKGSVVLENINPVHLAQIVPIFEYTGCKLKPYCNSIEITANRQLNSMDTIRTMPYPGFPTDAQAIMMSVATVSKGNTVFIENIFQDRYKHVRELTKLGAEITVEGKVAVVKGVNRLFGARVKCTDLRGAAGILIATLVAQGKSTIEEIFHLERGYEDFENKLNSLGADVKRIEKKEKK